MTVAPTIEPATRIRDTPALDEPHAPPPVDANPPAAAPGRWRRLRTSWVARPTVLLALIWLVLVVVAALAPGLIAPGDPIAGDVAQKLRAPSLEHWFGTDQLGRDVFTRVVHGAGLTIHAVLIAIGLGLIAGSAIGLVAGFAGGAVDNVFMRLADVLLAIPALLLSLTVIVALGFGTVNVALAVGIVSVASTARVMRAEVLKVKQSPYVEAARAGGARIGRVLLRHVLPNALGPVIVLAVLEFGTVILAISALSFLGYGAPPPAPEWGTIVSQGRDFLAGQPWISTLPGLVIAASVLSANRIAHALNERNDA